MSVEAGKDIKVVRENKGGYQGQGEVLRRGRAQSLDRVTFRSIGSV